MIDELREKANRLPLLPGVYLMLNEKGEVLYVGKAKALKNRVASYFRGEHEPKTAAMLSKVCDFDVIIAPSEFDALLLENSLIKRHQPHYNVLLRDDKSYPFIRLDIKSEFPSFSIVNKTSNDGAKYFGPFRSRGSSREIIDTVCKALKLPTCGKARGTKAPRDFAKGKGRPCLNYHMKNCAAYCAGFADLGEYKARMREAEMVLGGKFEELRSEIEKEMHEASEKLRFEQAAVLRDRIRAVESLSSRQKVIGATAADADVIGFYRGVGLKFCFAVLRYADGALVSKDCEILDDPLESNEEAVSALLRQYYSIRSVCPKLVLLPFKTEDMEQIERMLTEMSKHKVSIIVPRRGERRLMVENAMLNAKEECMRFTTAQERRMKTLIWLRDTLGLSALPERIEAFDISNTGNFGIVASMTVFVNGKPLKKDYRKFKIKQSQTQNDYKSMREVLSRRFKRYLDGDSAFKQLPDLLLVDGGAAHAKVAEDVLAELGITNLPVFGMVKDERHRTRALTRSTGAEIGLSTNPAAFALIGNIQEETHKTALENHRTLRSATIGSQLENIEGVGEKRRNDLLKHFKTIKAIRSASLEEISTVVSKNTAKAVYEYFRREGN